MFKSADNNQLYNKRGPYQTQGAPQPIKAGEIVTLFENRDITDEYVIIKPGKHIIQFRGIPMSNVIEFEIEPGTPDERDLLVSLLVNILPDSSWRITVPKRYIAPAGRKGEMILIILSRGHLGDAITVMLWKMKSPADVTERRDEQPSDYLGKNDSGYFYIEIPPKALDYWPTIKEDIISALNIENRSVQNP
jgi:hypothetical protein